MKQKPRTVKTIRQDKKTPTNKQIKKPPTSVAKVEDWENCQGRSLKNLDWEATVRSLRGGLEHLW